MIFFLEIYCKFSFLHLYINNEVLLRIDTYWSPIDPVITNKQISSVISGKRYMYVIKGKGKGDLADLFSA